MLKSSSIMLHHVRTTTIHSDCHESSSFHCFSFIILSVFLWHTHIHTYTLHALTRWNLSAWKITNYSRLSMDLIRSAWTEIVSINQMWVFAVTRSPGPTDLYLNFLYQSGQCVHINCWNCSARGGHKYCVMKIEHFLRLIETVEGQRTGEGTVL